MNTDWISLCHDVKNTRKVGDVFQHGQLEMDELDEEIHKKEYGLPAGEDGIIGEAVDVMLCMIDLIAQENPEIAMSEVEEIMHRKYAKWMEKYNSPS